MVRDAYAPDLHNEMKVCTWESFCLSISYCKHWRPACTSIMVISIWHRAFYLAGAFCPLQRCSAQI